MKLISIPALREEGDRRPRRCSLRLSQYFYPRPPRGGRRYRPRCPSRTCSISIPALREEGDRDTLERVRSRRRFLSPPSARRATRPRQGTAQRIRISIPALREEGDRRSLLQGGYYTHFYPRPPRGGRQVTDVEVESIAKFLSPPSARRATVKDAL